MNDPRNDNAERQLGEVGKTQNTQQLFSFPSPQSVKGRVLGALLRGEHLTNLDCWRRFGSARLSHHVYILRGIGWDVFMSEVTVKTSDAGRSASVGVYSLAFGLIEAAGERGQEYGAECARIELERRVA